MDSPRLPQEPISRSLKAIANKRLREFPVLTLTGPRQSGKTTLSRLLRPDAAYFSMENPDTRAFATEDPRGFLANLGDCSILDEVQHVPSLLSYLQGEVDADPSPGRFILTGSSQFELMESVTQSLAGRTSILNLFPFSFSELLDAGQSPATVSELLWKGLFPPIYDRPVAADVWLQNYVSTYVERDVRSLLNIRDSASFERFVKLCAGRCGQILNVTSLAADAGITRITAQEWLSVLQASHLIFLVQPWFTNLSKRLIKKPKLYFIDSGLAAWLIGIRGASQIRAHPMRGALFENWAMTELVKAQANAGQKPRVYFLRNTQGHELDAVIETAPGALQGVEMKSGATVASDFFRGLEYWQNQLKETSLTPWLVYGGETAQKRSRGQVLPWNGLEPLLAEIGK